MIHNNVMNLRNRSRNPPDMYQIASSLKDGLNRKYIRTFCSLNKRGFEEGKWVWKHIFTQTQRDDIINYIYMSLISSKTLYMKYIENDWLCSLDKLRVTINRFRRHSNMSLLDACRLGHLEILKYIFFEFKKVNYVIRNPLFFFEHACDYNRLEIAKFLVEYFKLSGTDIQSNENRILHRVCRDGRIQIVKFIVYHIKNNVSECRSTRDIFSEASSNRDILPRHIKEFLFISDFQMHHKVVKFLFDVYKDKLDDDTKEFFSSKITMNYEDYYVNKK